MISNPLGDIPETIASVVDELIPDNRLSGWANDASYLSTHKRRYARTLDVLFSESLGGLKLLEIATSDVIPIAINKLTGGTDITVTNFDLSKGTKGKHTCVHGDEKLVVPSYYVDLETMPLPAKDGEFDVILCCEVLEHLDVDPMFMLAELNRVLKDGGRLILTTPNITSSRGLWKMLRGIEPYFFMQYHKDGSPYRHNYEYSHSGLTAILKAAGFEGDIWTEDSFEDGVGEDVAFLEAAGFKLNKDLLGDNLFASVYKKSEVLDRYPSPIYV